MRRLLPLTAVALVLAALGGGASSAQVADEDVPSAGARKITLKASPGRVETGRLVRIRFTATAPSDDDIAPPIRCAAGACAASHRTVPVRRALVSFAGRRVRTDSRGRASMLVRFRSVRVHRARATRSGLRPGTARVSAVSPRFAG